VVCRTESTAIMTNSSRQWIDLEAKIDELFLVICGIFLLCELQRNVSASLPFVFGLQEMNTMINKV